jgi:hypothetical protein
MIGEAERQPPRIGKKHRMNQRLSWDDMVLERHQVLVERGDVGLATGAEPSDVESLLVETGYAAETSIIVALGIDDLYEAQVNIGASDQVTPTTLALDNLADGQDLALVGGAAGAADRRNRP